MGFDPSLIYNVVSRKLQVALPYIPKIKFDLPYTLVIEVILAKLANLIPSNPIKQHQITMFLLLKS